MYLRDLRSRTRDRRTRGRGPATATPPRANARRGRTAAVNTRRTDAHKQLPITNAAEGGPTVYVSWVLATTELAGETVRGLKEYRPSSRLKVPENMRYMEDAV